MNKVLKGHAGHDFCQNFAILNAQIIKAFKMINRNDCQLLRFMQDKEFTRLCNVNKDRMCNDFVYIQLRPVLKLKLMCKTMGNKNLCQK